MPKHPEGAQLAERWFGNEINDGVGAAMVGVEADSRGVETNYGGVETNLYVVELIIGGVEARFDRVQAF